MATLACFRTERGFSKPKAMEHGFSKPQTGGLESPRSIVWVVSPSADTP